MAKKHYILHPDAWAKLNWRAKLRVRRIAWHMGAIVRPNRTCPRNYVYLLDPSFQVLKPISFNIGGSAPLTQRNRIEQYGRLTLLSYPKKGKITWLKN